ncbi:MAG: hypothetical protein IPJ03_02090 [Ignavibacteriales bacterium]|nr:hypothetical protein [Ignavibacteriales bacterium]
MEFEIFKTGSHTSDKGITKDYSLDDLNFIAQSYDPEVQEAPIVIGHPVDSSPAYGWVESLKVVGDRLIAKAKDLIPEFKEALDKKLYKKRSISLDSEGKLRHIGFLGGALPAVKGLADIQFSDEITNTIEFSTESSESSLELDPVLELAPELDRDLEPELSSNKNLFTSFSVELESLKNSLSTLSQNFSEFSTANVSNELTNLSNQVKSITNKLDLSQFNQLLDDKVTSGNLTPALRSKLESLVGFVGAYNFSDGVESFQSKLINHLSEFINSMPKVLYLENFAEKPNDSVSIKDDFNGLPVNQESALIHRKALSIMKSENISYLSAVHKVTKP